MLLPISPAVLSILVLLVIVVFFVAYILSKMQIIENLKQKIRQLNFEINELDHQAKLIVQNDMELKLYQEEIEDKLKKLSLLRSLISTSINILNKEELFLKLDEALINNLGFKKALLILSPQEEIELNINFLPAEIETFKKILSRKSLLLNEISVISNELIAADENMKPILEQLDFKDFIFAPIDIGTQTYAIFILGKCLLPFGIAESDMETFSIICMYLGQCLDNIKLFESLYHTGEELESKVKEKTFQLTKSLDEIKEISKLKSEFISGVSHELRTPLTSIKGFSSLLVAEKFGVLPPKAKEKLQKIDNNIDKLVNMVNTLLDISRIESKRTEVKISPADLTTLIKDIGELLTPQMTEKKIEFSTEIPEKLNVYIDKNLIERVFINIINNAIKFTPEGGKITVRCKTDSRIALVTIEDTGRGIKKEDIEKVFQEFYRTTSAIGIKGSGLGLSLVKKIMETHGQKIWVESEIAKGTSFNFTLKIAQ